jgi:1-acylglycerone phosphate reductase
MAPSSTLTTLRFTSLGYNMPISDIDIHSAKSLFDLNVWSYIAITQAFLPLLINASQQSPNSPPSLILNNTSISSIEPTPHNSVYHASKAAAAMFSTHMRIELQPFNIHVIDLKTGCVHSRFHANHQSGNASLPEGSLYAKYGQDVKDMTEGAMRNAFPDREDPDKWARDVVRDVTSRWESRGWIDRRRGTYLPLEIWRGTGSWRVWLYNCTIWPVGWWDGWWRRAVGLDLLGQRVRKGFRT